jgi:glycosyltransferase involved in cell wall biosynthesis
VGARPDIAVVSLGTTIGWQRADSALAELIEEAGASCEIVPVRIGPLARLRRGMALTDLIEARAARRSAKEVEAGAIVYSSVTAALLQRRPVPYAVRFDAPAALNRPGLGGAWQRRRERGVLAGARLLLPWSEPAAVASRALVEDEPPAVVLPPPVEAAVGTLAEEVDGAAYAGNPDKRGLALLCEAWRLAAPEGARLVVGGIDRERALRHLRRAGAPPPPGVEWAGSLSGAEWRSLVAAARVFVNASRYEDFGIAQLEALAAGTPLVTVASAGPNVALPVARRLAPELVAERRNPDSLAGALRAGLGLSAQQRAAYGQAARLLLEPYGREELARVVRHEVLPRLLTSSS